MIQNHKRLLQRVGAKLWLWEPTPLQQVVCDVIGVHIWIRAGTSGEQLPHEDAVWPLRERNHRILYTPERFWHERWFVWTHHIRLGGELLCLQAFDGHPLDGQLHLFVVLNAVVFFVVDVPRHAKICHLHCVRFIQPGKTNTGSQKFRKLGRKQMRLQLRSLFISRPYLVKPKQLKN